METRAHYSYKKPVNKRFLVFNLKKILTVFLFYNILTSLQFFIKLFEKYN